MVGAGYSLVSRGGVGVALAAAGNRSSKHVDKRQEVRELWLGCVVGWV